MSFDENMKSSFCQYKIDKKKESTCRVVMWREFGVENSLTLECSYCSGENKKVLTKKIVVGRNNFLVVEGDNRDVAEYWKKSHHCPCEHCKCKLSS